MSPITNPAPNPTRPDNPPNLDNSPDNKLTYQEHSTNVSAFLGCRGFEHLGFDEDGHIFADPDGTAASVAKGYFNHDTVEAAELTLHQRQLQTYEDEWRRRNRRRKSDSTADENTDGYCFAHRHMTFKEFGLWVYVRGVSSKTGTFYFDGRSVGKQFDGQGKGVAYRAEKSLIAKGWFEVVKATERNETGTYSATHIRALSHAEWAKKHPNQCPKPVPKSGQVTVNGDAEPELTSPRNGT